MAAHYKETPWHWYVAVLVLSFILGLVVVIKEHITLSAWAYVVSLLLGIFIAPFVSIATYDTCLLSESADVTAEHPSLLSLRQRYCHKQSVENVGGPDAPWTPRW